jgi:hypothetical protein
MAFWKYPQNIQAQNLCLESRKPAALVDLAIICEKIGMDGDLDEQFLLKRVAIKNVRASCEEPQGYIEFLAHHLTSPYSRVGNYKSAKLSMVPNNPEL